MNFMRLLNRFIGGAFILFILMSITIMGFIPLAIGVSIFSVIAIYEMRRCIKNMGFDFSLKEAVFYDLVIMFGAYTNSDTNFLMIIIGLIITLLIRMVFSKKYNIHDFMILFFVLFYVSVLMSHIIRVYDIKYTWVLYIIAWGTDTFAYLVGSVIGKNKIKSIAHISPNKTIEGSLGGIVASVICVVLFKMYFGLNTGYPFLIFITIICSILSQIGDLVASFIKRQAGIKDYGNIIKGHGGIMDRFDSMLFLAPVIYYMSMF